MSAPHALLLSLAALLLTTEAAGTPVANALAFACVIAGTFVGVAALAANLQGLDVAALPGDRVELKLAFDEPVTVPRGYTIDQPARIALDLPGVTNKLGSRNRDLGVGNARSLTVVEAKVASARVPTAWSCSCRACRTRPKPSA